MQYVRSISGSVSKTWNSINPATLSGAIDVIVVEREDGTLACSPFHVRFGKFQLLRPSDKKVEFRVNNEKRTFPMKLGEGGEAFFVFETSDNIPHDMQTSPLVSPVASPRPEASDGTPAIALPEPDSFTLGEDDTSIAVPRATLGISIERPKSVDGTADTHEGHLDGFRRPMSGDWSALGKTSSTSSSSHVPPFERAISQPLAGVDDADEPLPLQLKPKPNEAYGRALALSKKLGGSNIASQVSPTGDLMLDMTGYKSDEEQALKTEVIARKILSEQIEGYDIGSLIGADDKGNIWIYASEEAKEAADRKAGLSALNPLAMRSADAVSDPGYHSDDGQSDAGTDVVHEGDRYRRDSDSAVGFSSPGSPESGDDSKRKLRLPTRNYAKTLRLTHDQLKSLDLKQGPNTMSFTVNKATCQAYIYYWKHDVPIVISDIDGTITKSDALGHVLNMIGRDWTHMGVAKLYTDIVANGYNILYLTSRSVGQADTTRGYLHGVAQEGFRLPKGPVILSPDRTMAALRREVYLRKPEVFKMACLRDIMNLFQEPIPENVSPNYVHFHQRTPFYAGFGNRLTDALSYRSVAIPPTRIFTINSNAEVNLHLLTLNSYRTSYLSIWELVDHYFPPVGLLVKEGGEEYTDFNYWRDRPLEMDDFSASDSEDDEDDVDGYRPSIDGTEQDEMEISFLSEAGRDSLDENMRESAILDTVEEEEFEDHSLRDSFIAEEPEELHDDEYLEANIDEVGEDIDEDDILVEESRQLQALDLAADEEESEAPASLQRFASSPDRPRSSTSRKVQEHVPDDGLDESG